MAAVTLTPTDLAPFASIDEAKAQAMIDTALARAARVAPCIRDDTLSADNSTAAMGVIRDAVLRWEEGGQGAYSSRSVGAVAEAFDTRQQRRALFWPSEIEELQAICREHSGAGATGVAFSISTTLAELELHSETCALRLGGTYCDCGAVYAGAPIFGPDAIYPKP